MAFAIKLQPQNHSNTTHDQNQPIDVFSRLITVAQFDTIASLGMIANLLPFAATVFGYVKRNIVNCLIANLAFSELLLCVSFVFGQSFIVLWRESLPDAWCQFLSFIHFVAAFACFMFPPMLALNRYIALYTNPNFYKKLYSKRRATVMILGCWLFCSIVPLGFLLAGKTGFDEDNDHCCLVVKEAEWIVAYFLLIIAPLVCCCDGVMIFCNYKIYMKLKKHAQGGLPVNVVRHNREMLYFLAADMCSPILFHSSYHLFKFILIGRESEFLKRFFISLYLVNSAMRGTITITMLKPYRVGVKRMILRKGMNVVEPLSTRYPVSTRYPDAISKF